MIFNQLAGISNVALLVPPIVRGWPRSYSLTGAVNEWRAYTLPQLQYQSSLILHHAFFYEPCMTVWTQNNNAELFSRNYYNNLQDLLRSIDWKTKMFFFACFRK